MTDRRAQRLVHVRGTADRLARFVERLDDLFLMRQQGARLRQGRFFARLRVQGVQLGKGVAHEVFFGAGALEPAPAVGERRLRRLPVAPGLGDFGALRRQPAIGVQHGPVRGRVHQAALLGLALDFHQAVADLAQQRDARRLVVDEGARLALGGEDPAQQDRAFGLAAVARENLLPPDGRAAPRRRR